MVSYSWDDAEVAELLHEELALRGMTVIHDRCTFQTGTRIPTSMADAVATCDGYIVYFTPSSLYENRPDAASRPVIDDEFVPIMNRYGQERPKARPVVVAVPHGLGDVRAEAPDRIRKATGCDISSLWSPISTDQTAPQMSQSEAAALAESMLRALLDRTRNDHVAPVPVTVVTRGTGQSPDWLTIDATNLVGGTEPQPGSVDSWTRIATAIADVEGHLAAATTVRELSVSAHMHLSAAIVFGRTFHQAAGWRLTVAGRNGPTRLPTDATVDAAADISLSADVGGPGDMTVEIDLVGVDVSSLAPRTIAGATDPVPTRVFARRDSTAGLQPDVVGAAAKKVADEVRRVAHQVRPGVIHVFCASPVEFGVLLGHQLTSLHATLQLYERDGDRYVRSVTIGS